MAVNTIDGALKAYFKPKRNYEKEIKKHYEGAEGLELSDEDDLLYAIGLVREGNSNGAVDYLYRRDTEVREVFFRMLKDDPKYDWNGNRK